VPAHAWINAVEGQATPTETRIAVAFNGAFRKPGMPWASPRQFICSWVATSTTLLLGLALTLANKTRLVAT
jgi:hypothetical protein